jgi:hypothetical protein
MFLYLFSPDILWLSSDIHVDYSVFLTEFA